MSRRKKSYIIAASIVFSISLVSYLTIERSISNSSRFSSFFSKNKGRKSESRELSKRHRVEMKALKAQNQAELKAWVAAERDARRLYFNANPEGEKKREYIQEYIHRREVFESELKQKVKTLKEQQDAERKALLQGAAAETVPTPAPEVSGRSAPTPAADALAVSPASPSAAPIPSPTAH